MGSLRVQVLLSATVVLIVLAGCFGSGVNGGFVVSGVVLDENDIPVSDVLIFVSGVQDTSVRTGGAGTWQATQLEGSVTITPVKPGWVFEPESVTKTEDAEGVIFVGQYDPANYNPVEIVSSNPGGGFSGATSVELEYDEAGYSIYYTFDGSIPTTSSKEYTGPITIDNTTRLTAIAINDQNIGSTSRIHEAFYIKDAVIWLDAAAADTVQLDGDNRVVQLLDKSGNDYHAAGVGTLPLYVEDAINGKPAFRFEDRTNGFWLDYNMGAFDNITIYIVHQRLADVVDDSQHGRLISAAPDPEKDVWVAPNYHLQPGDHQNDIPYDALLQRVGRSGIEGGPIAIAMDAVHYSRWNAFGSGCYVGDIAEVLIVGRNVPADTAENDLIIQLLTDKWDL